MTTLDIPAIRARAEAATSEPRKKARAAIFTLCDEVERQAAEIAKRDARIAELEKALKPFCFGDAATEHALYRDMPETAKGTITISLATIRNARNALAGAHTP